MQNKTQFLAAALLLAQPSVSYSFDISPFQVGDSLNTTEAKDILQRFKSRPEQPWIAPSRSELPTDETIAYGLKILTHTSEIVGPQAPNPTLRYSRTNLNCVACHQPGESGLPGTRKYSLPWTNVMNDYPTLDVKSMRIISLEDRILGMLGGGPVKMTKDSREMKAIMAYLTWLSSKAKPGMRMNGTGYFEAKLPTRAANPLAGKALYKVHCMACHGPKGLGMRRPNFDTGGGYLFPPIAGDDTYDDGGHMYMIPLLAKFIYTNMPLGVTPEKPKLTRGEALDIAAYINSDLPRFHSLKRGEFYPNPLFRPKGFAIPKLFPNDPEAFHKAKFGPFE